MALTPRRTDAALSAGVGLLALAVYLRSLLPGVGYSGDTAKWQFLGVVGGVPHATGYPLYLALDHVWVRIVPFGTVAWRVNLLSAVLGAAAVAGLYVLLRILEVRRPVAVAAALVFALTRTFWSQAVVAEVYTLHLLFLVTVTACLAHWRKGGANAWLLAGLGIYALSFGHHLTTGLALPGIVWLVWSDRQRALQVKNVVFVAGAALVAAAQYLFLLRMSDVGGYHESNIDGFDDVVNYATGGDFKSSMFVFSWYGLLVGRVPLVADLVVTEYSVLLALAGLGLWAGLRQASPALRAVVVHVALLAVFQGIYVLNYDVPDLIVFCLPLFLALGVFVGLGLDAVVGWVGERRPDDRWVAPGVAAALAALVVVVGLVDYGRASQRGTVQDAARIERAFDTVGESAVLITDGYHDSEYIWYFLLGEGLGDERDLALANQVTPAMVREWFTSRSGPVAVAARGVDGRPDPPLYTASPGQAEALAADGFTVVEVAEDVWQVDL